MEHRNKVPRPSQRHPDIPQVDPCSLWWQREKPCCARADRERASVFYEVLARRAVNAARIPLSDVHRDLECVFGLPREAPLKRHLVRALDESGVLDVLHPADGYGSLVVPRQPHWVAYRLGDSWRATLMGLASYQTVAEIEKRARMRKLEPSYRPPSQTCRRSRISEPTWVSLHRGSWTGPTSTPCRLPPSRPEHWTHAPPCPSLSAPVDGAGPRRCSPKNPKM